MQHRLDLSFSNVPSYNVELTCLNPSAVSFTLGSVISQMNIGASQITASSISFEAASTREDVQITVGITTNGDPSSLDFKLERCDKLTWTLDEERQQTVGEGDFSIRL